MVFITEKTLLHNFNNSLKKIQFYSFKNSIIQISISKKISFTFLKFLILSQKK